MVVKSEQPGWSNPITGNPYWIVGVMLIVANILPGIVLFAVLASIIGEDVLENGSLSWLGAALVYSGPVVGLMLILFGRPLSRRLSPTRVPVPLAVVGFGVLCVAAGVFGVMDDSQGANIGAGILLLFGPLIIVVGLLWLVAAIKFSDGGRPPPK